MKKLTFVPMFLAVFAFVLASCGPTKNDAIDYNDKIIREQKKIIQVEKELIDAIKKNLIKGNTLDDIMAEFTAQIEDSRKVIEELGNLGSKSEFKDAALAFLDAYKDVVDNEYKKWLVNIRIPDEEVTADVLYEEDELIASINRKLDKANSDFIGAQKDFCAKWDIVLNK